MILRRTHIIFILAALAIQNCFAQFGADFSVISEIGCSSFTVNVIDNSGAPANNVIVYNYGDGTGETNDTFHIYTSPGIYKIVQTVANGTPRQDSVFVEVIEPRAPEFVLSNCKGTEAFIYITDTLYSAYWVDWGDGNTSKILSGQLLPHDYGGLGSFTVAVKGLVNEDLGKDELANINCSTASRTINLIDDIVEGTVDRVEVLDESRIRVTYTTNAETAYFLELCENGADDFSTIEIISSSNYPDEFIVEGLNTTDNFYCFRITAFDPCDGTTKPSQVGCSIKLDVAAENNQNRLSWLTQTSDLNNYDVFKDSSFFASTGINEYTDTEVECGVVYCYYVVMHENNGMESVSNQKCDTAFSNDTPPQISDISASVENNRVVVIWEEVQPEPEYYGILRSENGNPYSDIKISENVYVDSAATPDRNRYFYQIYFEDKCDNQSPSVLASPVFLSNTSASSLNWNAYLGWQNGPQSYLLEKYSIDGELLSATNVGLDTVFEETDFGNLPQQVIYRIVAVASDPALQNVNSNFLELTFPSTVVFPNAFTPNGDGLNDFFTFKGKYVTNYKLTIFNRWGELMFETDEMDSGWDGTFNAKPVPSGVYIFNAEFEDEMGVQFSKKGEIYLLR